jgi:hypothetical protein
MKNLAKQDLSDDDTFNLTNGSNRQENAFGGGSDDDTSHLRNGSYRQEIFWEATFIA